MNTRRIITVAALAACGGGETPDDTDTLRDRAEQAARKYGPADATDEQIAEVVEAGVSICENGADSFGARLAMSDAVEATPILADVYGDICPDVLELALTEAGAD